MDVNLRRRTGPAQPTTQDLPEKDSSYELSSKNKAKHLSLLELSCLVFCILGLAITAMFPHYHLPAPKRKKKSNETEFTAEQARYYLEGITNIGHRTVGSYRNDIMAVNYLVKEIYSIISHAHVHYNFDVEVQTASGSYSIHFLRKDFTIAYNNISNVIVHMYPKHPRNASEINILVNAHFDTQPRTEGASDDAVSCAIMLESMRAISRSPPRTIKQGIVFLFNGAEEGLLDGSHAFVTKHKLAKTIKAFVNLEAAGSGGREIVFQTGPGQPWLIYEYASSAKYPYASVIAQEIFQSGVIPSDTDFRIFRDFGNLVGIDIAYSSNGYVYHTYHDNATIIPNGSIQRGGDNVLSVIKSLSKSPYLNHEKDFKKGKIIFFDLFGFTMILYPQRIGVMIDIACILAAIGYVIFQTFSSVTAKRLDNSDKPNLLMLFISTCTVILSWAFAIIVTLLEAFILTRLGRSLSWYSNPWFTLLLYGTPALAALVLAHQLSRNILNKACDQSKINLGLLYEKSCILAHLLIISSIVIFLTYKNILSTYLFTGYLLFPLIFHALIRSEILQTYHDELFSEKIIFIHVGAVAFPTLLTTYNLFSVFDVFVPIMGRQGSEIPPDMVFAVLSSASIIIITFFAISAVHLVEKQFSILKFLACFSVFTFFLAASGIMFPYSSQNPVAPKRLFMQHVVRNFHNEDGRVVKNDSGLWLVPLDYLGIQPLMHLPSLKNSAEVECDGPYCGFPYFFPLRKLLKKTWYLKGVPPFSGKKKLASFKITRKEKISDAVTRFHFQVVGPDHMTLYVTPENTHKLVASSFTEETPSGQPDFDGRTTFFTYFTHGFYAEPWQFWLDFENVSGVQDAVFADIALANHFLHGPLSMTKFLQSVIAELPPWVIETCWVSSYDVWKIKQ